MFQRYVVLTNAAMEGARVSILPSYTTPMPRTGLNRTPPRWRSWCGDGCRHAGDPAEPGGGTWPAVQVVVNHNYTFDYIGPIMHALRRPGRRTSR